MCYLHHFHGQFFIVVFVQSNMLHTPLSLFFFVIFLCKIISALNLADILPHLAMGNSVLIGSGFAFLVEFCASV